MYQEDAHVLRVQQERVTPAQPLERVGGVEIPLEVKLIEWGLVTFGPAIVHWFSTTIACCISNNLIQILESVLLDDRKELPADPVLPATPSCC